MPPEQREELFGTVRYYPPVKGKLGGSPRSSATGDSVLGTTNGSRAKGKAGGKDGSGEVGDDFDGGGDGVRGYQMVATTELDSYGQPLPYRSRSISPG